MIPYQYPSVRLLFAIYSAYDVIGILSFVGNVDCYFDSVVFTQANISESVSDVQCPSPGFGDFCTY